jgi:cytochrome c oxidase subunit 2
LRAWIRNASAIKPGVLMPSFPNLSESDLTALADYLASLN